MPGLEELLIPVSRLYYAAANVLFVLMPIAIMVGVAQLSPTLWGRIVAPVLGLLCSLVYVFLVPPAL